MVEGEINNFIMVWSVVFTSVSYCYAISKIIPKGKLRLITFFPIICLFLFLPFNLNTIHLGCPTVFSICWLANFKILLLATGNGPLTDSSLSMFQFVMIASFPVVLKKHTKNKNAIRKLSISTCVKRALALVFLINFLSLYKNYLHEKVHSFLVCLYIVSSLELLLTTIGVIGEFVLGLELEPPFNQPFLSNSLKEFWGWRWNRVSKTVLRASIFDPIIYYLPPSLGSDFILCLGVLGTFVISGAIHEILHFFVSRGKNGGGTATFFLFHGVLLGSESLIKGRISNKWRLPQIIIGPVIYLFMIYTFMIFALPQLMECDICGRAIQEWRAFGAFLGQVRGLYT